MNETPNLMPQMSEKFDVVIKSLMSAKKEMGSTVKKDAKNPFHKSSYASLGAHLDLCEAVLDKHGLIMLQTINGSHDKAVLIATLCHAESGQWIKSYLPLPNPKSDSQGLGASITYMRRYSINSMLGLNAEDDDGESTRHKPESKQESKAEMIQHPASAQRISGAQVVSIKKLEAKLDNECKGKIYAWLLKTYRVKSIEEVTMEHFGTVLSAFQNAVKYIETASLEVAHA